jgi:hypothetical protein
MSRGYRRDKSDERSKMMEEMIEERIRSGATLEQVAKNHGVCIRTVTRWKATDQWRAIENKWRRIMREESRTEINEAIPDAIAVLSELMSDPSVSSFTRMNSAKALLEFSGVADEIEETKVDQHDELLEFLKKVEKRPTMEAGLLDIQVLDGGLIPPQLSGSIADTVDAEYTEIESSEDSLD